jgi:hypothetical protein
MADVTPLRTPGIAGIGHNRPPEIIEPVDSQVLQARLAIQYSALVERFTELELGAAQVPQSITTEEEAKTVTGWIGQQCKMHMARTKEIHDVEKKPFLDGGRVVDRFFLDRIKRLTNVIGPIERRVQRFYDAKKAAQRLREDAERRRAAEEHKKAAAEAQRLQAEAAIRNAAGDRPAAVGLTLQAEEAAGRAATAQAIVEAPPAPVIVRGEYGATAFAVERWDYEIEDLEAVPDGYWTIDDEAIRQAIAEGVRDIAGLRIFPFDRFTIKRC